MKTAFQTIEMKTITLFIFVLGSLLVITGCSSAGNNYRLTKTYKPDDLQLYKTIIGLDSTFFGAYNTCDKNLEKYASFYADDIEFYHDKGGLINNKQALVDGTQKNICGKVTRELVKGSIEVYPIKDYGAIEIGLHKFHNSQEPQVTPKAGRFTIIWQKLPNGWKIVKVISLH